MKNYFIKENYVHRLDNAYFDDTSLKDQWQKEVYVYAKKIAEEHNINNILDIGTGSGYKLLENFKNFNTLGMDVEQTVTWLNDTYPDKKWTSNFQPVSGYELIIASDVIEHIPDPDTLLDLIEKSQPKFIVFSTPDRDLLNRTPDGPPKNKAHVREWTMPEFFNYINSRFEVIEHFISNKKQSTQVILARIRSQ